MQTTQTDGTVLRVTEIANVHYFEFTERYQTREDTHDFCELLFIDRGSISVHAQRYTGELCDNQLLIHRPCEPHSLSCQGGNAPNVIILDFRCDCPDLIPFCEAPITLSAEERRLLSEVMKEGMALFEPPYDIPYSPKMKQRASCPYGTLQMLQLRLELFLLTLIRSHLRKSPLRTETVSTGKMADVYAYLTEHYTEKILLDNLCFLFGTNKTSLCNDFKAEYGTTITDYVQTLRLTRAKELLRKSSRSVTEISRQLGYHSVHYFCRSFKKATGFTPKEYTATILSKLNT